MRYLHILLRNEYIQHGFGDMVASFNRVHKDIQVKMIAGPASIDARKKIYEKNFKSRKQVFDLIYLDPGWIPEWIYHGYLTPINDLINRNIWNYYYPADIQPYVCEGKTWAVPIELDAGVLFYRKDILEKAGYPPPKTWDDIITMSVQLQHPPSLWGYTWQGAAYEGLTVHFLELLWGAGGEWIDMKGSVDMKRIRVAEKVLSFLKSCIYDACITPKEVLHFKEFDSGLHFLKGHAIFHRNWPALYRWSKKDISAVKDKVGFCGMIHQKGYKGYSARGGLGFGISSLSKRKKAAASFIRFCINRSNQKKLYNSLGIIPAHRGGLAKSADPDLKRFYTIIQTARARPQLNNYAQCSQVLQKNIRTFLDNKLTIRKTLNNIINQTEKILS